MRYTENTLEVIKLTFRIPFHNWKNGYHKYTVTTSLQGSSAPVFRFQKKFQPIRPTSLLHTEPRTTWVYRRALPEVMGDPFG
jgi:hypothetical protein